MAHLSDAQQSRRQEAQKLLQFIQEGNLRRVERALVGGADIDGGVARLDYLPLVLAAECGLVKMVKLLLRRGADVNAPVPRDVRCPDHGCEAYRMFAGSTALHAATHKGTLDVFRLLLRWGGDPNAIDSKGFTPLHIACTKATARATDMVEALLKAGADPLLADTRGRIPLHATVEWGRMDLLDMVLLEAPSALNRSCSEGFTPLCLAVLAGRHSMVLHLLRLGARQPVELDRATPCPLKAAVELDHCEVLRILLDHGMDAIGSTDSIAAALGSAVCNGRARNAYEMLARVHGDDERQRLARVRPGGGPTLLRCSVSHGLLAMTSVLLAAGADETALDEDERRASEVMHSEDDVDPVTEAALLRMLERGPAFRAASWTWQAGADSSVGVADGTEDVLPGRQQTSPLGVRIFRPRRKSVFLILVNGLAR